MRERKRGARGMMSEIEIRKWLNDISNQKGYFTNSTATKIYVLQKILGIETDADKFLKEIIEKKKLIKHKINFNETPRQNYKRYLKEKEVLE